MVKSLHTRHLGPCLAECENYIKYCYLTSLGAQEFYNVEVITLQLSIGGNDVYELSLSYCLGSVLFPA